MNYAQSDIDFMREALRLGALGKGSVFPNPPVGALIVRDEEIIGRGWHRQCGDKHAEVLAVENAWGNGHDLRGSTMYVTLEPCCHHGKTPPCTDRIIAEGISQVYISCLDDYDSRVCGIGAQKLVDAGIKVYSGLLEREGLELIEHYIIQRLEGRAFLSLKWASSLDGRIATRTGDSQWISGKSARGFAHRLRSMHSAVAVGYNTLIADDPQLTVRSVKTHHKPVRIILAGGEIIPGNRKMFAGGPSIIVVNPSPEQGKLESRPDIIYINIAQDERFWSNLLRKLPEHGIGSVLVEGGGEIITSALRQRAADRIYCVIAPLIIGSGIAAINELDIEKVEKGLNLEDVRHRKFEKDILITGRLAKN